MRLSKPVRGIVRKMGIGFYPDIWPRGVHIGHRAHPIPSYLNMAQAGQTIGFKDHIGYIIWSYNNGDIKGYHSHIGLMMHMQMKGISMQWYMNGIKSSSWYHHPYINIHISMRAYGGVISTALYNPLYDHAYNWSFPHMIMPSRECAGHDRWCDGIRGLRSIDWVQDHFRHDRMKIISIMIGDRVGQRRGIDQEIGEFVGVARRVKISNIVARKQDVCEGREGHDQIPFDSFLID